jgi:dolichol-phosphate mannosyltransferase
MATQTSPQSIFLDNPQKFARPAKRRHEGPELTVIVPTLNERANIGQLVALLETALANVAWEVIFVDDDSKDGTADLVRTLAGRNSRVRCIQRIGRRGLASACVEGLLASSANYVAVMDGDLQHDERLLPRMLEVLRHEPCDLVVGSRYVEGGEIGDFGARRAQLSSIATRLSRAICKAELADPMSGFFMVRREVFHKAVRRLSSQGFKILLDLVASSPEPLRIKELPFRFRSRQNGTSKLDNVVALEFGVMIVDKLVGKIIPIRFLQFALIGILGLGLHLSVLWSALQLLGFGFLASQAIATGVAMTFNFFLNNTFTYRDLRLRGWRQLQGLLSFYIVCGLGALANLAVAFCLYRIEGRWLLAGIGGVAIGSIWNYSVSSITTWRN